MTAWDISTTIHSATLSVSGRMLDPSGIHFKPDGFKMYILGRDKLRVFEYDLSTAWDISSASFLQRILTFPPASSISGLFFKPDGLKFYISGDATDEIHEYNLSVAWDISTIIILQSFDISGEITSRPDIFFKSDGLKVYAVGEASEIFEYDLSIAWDISSSSLLQSFDASAQGTDTTGLFFRPNGLKVYLTNATSDDINEYDLSAAWDITTASFLQSFDISSKSSLPAGVFFKPDGTKYYVPDAAATINEYNLPVPLPVAAFSATPRKKIDDLTAVFDDESENEPTSWSWKRRPSGIKADYVEFSTDENPSEEFDIESP